MFIKLALKSLMSRKGSVLLTLISMSISVFVLLGVEHIRHQTKESFSSTVSGVDLIVGARTGSLNLLLYSVFHVGAPTNNVSWKSYELISNDGSVDWAIPVSLGDSHRGYRVLGTTPDYFKRYKYGKRQPLSFEGGKPFEQVFDVVLGSEVAKTLGYRVDDQIVIAHGIAKTSFKKHKENPFTIVGILSATGTPVDQTVHVSLQGIEAVHHPGKHENTLIENSQFNTQSITAVMLGLKSKMATFKVQRLINQYRKEPLTAILPGVALLELWQMVGVLENVLRLIAGFVLLASLLGLSAMLLTSIRERSREIELLRMIGASPLYIFFLIQLEAIIITLCSMILGAGSLSAVVFFSGDLISSNLGLTLSANIFTSQSLYFCFVVLLSSVMIAMVPSVTSYLKAKRAR